MCVFDYVIVLHSKNQESFAWFAHECVRCSAQCIWQRFYFKNTIFLWLRAVARCLRRVEELHVRKLCFFAEASAEEVNFKIQILSASFLKGVGGASLDLGFFFLCLAKRAHCWIS